MCGSCGASELQCVSESRCLGVLVCGSYRGRELSFKGVVVHEFCSVWESYWMGVAIQRSCSVRELQLSYILYIGCIFSFIFKNQTIKKPADAIQFAPAYSAKTHKKNIIGKIFYVKINSGLTQSSTPKKNTIVL